MNFVYFFGVKQLKFPTRTTTSSSAIINHILAIYPEQITQCAVIEISLPDHQLIYCTRKISRIKRSWYKQIQFRSFKHYTVNLSEPDLSKLNFPNYQNYNEINEINEDLRKALKSPGLPNEIYYCEVSALKANNTAQLMMLTPF